MKIAVLGAGMQGSACAFDLARAEGVTEISLLDESAARLDAAARLVTDGAREAGRSTAVRTQVLDVTDETSLAGALAGAKAVVSAVPYFLNVALARAAIKAGASFCDMGGNTGVVREELALDADAKKAGVSLIPDCGLAPGLGNVLLAHAVASFDETTEGHIRVGGLPVRPRPPMNYKLVFSAHGLINEYVGEATVLRGGRQVKIPTLTEVERIDFPEPVGACEAFMTAGGSSTLPWTYEGKIRDLTYKTVRYPGHVDQVRALEGCGFFSLEPVTIRTPSGQVSIRPRDLAATLLTRALDFPEDTDLVVLRVTVKGRRGKARVTRVYEMIDRMDEAHGITAMMRTTAYPVAVAAWMQARGDVRPGAHPPEVALPPGPYLEALAARGLEIRQEERQEGGA